MRRNSRSLILCLCLVPGGLLAALPAARGGDAPAGAARSPRDFFPRNPLAYAEVREAGMLEAKLAAFKLWGNPDAAAKGIARLGDLAAKQLAMQAGGDAKEFRQALAQVKALRIAVYPPISWPPEPLVAVEVPDPAAFLKLLGGPGGPKKLAAQGGTELWTLPVSLNGYRKTTVAATAGSTVLLSPFESRLRQALDVAASGAGALESSPGFADCAKRFGDRPVWAYFNADALCAVGMLEEHDAADAQPILAALALPSFRWAGLGSSLGEGRVPFEVHVEYFPWNPLGGILGRSRPADDCVAAAVPADAAFFACASLGDPAQAWKQLKARILAIGPLGGGRGGQGRDEAARALEELNREMKKALGVELEKDLLPLLSGDLGCFVSGGDDPSFGLVLAARDEEAAKKLMEALKVKDGTVGRIGGEQGRANGAAARVGRAVIVGEEEELLQGVVAAVAAGKTLAGSAAYKTQLEALGAERGAVVFVPSGALRKAARREPWGALLAENYHAAASLTVTKTGLTLRCTGPMEALLLAPALGELDRMAAEMERNACRERMEAIAGAAREFARKNDGRLPAALADLGPEFKAGAPSRTCPATGKEYVLAGGGRIPERAVQPGRGVLWCHEAGTPHRDMSWTITVHGPGNLAVNQFTTRGGALEKRLTQDRALMALADPAREPASAEERKAAEAAAADLGVADFDKREAATAKLRAMGPKCMPVVVGLLDNKDLEVANRAEQVLRELTGLADRAALRRAAGLPPAPGGEQPVPRRVPKPAPPVEQF